MVVVGLGYDFLFKSLLAHCDKSKKSEMFGPNVADKYALAVTKNLGFLGQNMIKKNISDIFSAVGSCFPKNVRIKLHFNTKRSGSRIS